MKHEKFAGFIVRVCSHLLDVGVVGVLSILVSFLALGMLYGFRAYAVRGSEGHEFIRPDHVQIFLMMAYGCVSFPYYVWGHYRFGTTIGKFAFHAFVVDEKAGEPITWGQSVLRWFGYWVSWFLAAGFILALLNRRKRALHDWIAGTVVVIRKPSENYYRNKIPD